MNTSHQQRLGHHHHHRRHHRGCCYATFASDVYSFAIVLWELVGLEEFDRRYGSCPEDFESAVCDEGYRPCLRALDRAIADDLATHYRNRGHNSSNGSSRHNHNHNHNPLAPWVICRHRDLRVLVEACWHEDCRQRPSFETILNKLREMLPPTTVPQEQEDLEDQQQQNQLQQQEQEQQQRPAGRRRKSRRRFSGSKFNSVSMGLTNHSLGPGTTNHSVALSDLFENDMHLDETDEYYDDETDDGENENDQQSFAIEESSVTIPTTQVLPRQAQAPHRPFSVPLFIAGGSHASSTRQSGLPGLGSNSNSKSGTCEIDS